jgi:methylated-DNA-[protein]-cysteine S-methyltransferase
MDREKEEWEYCYDTEIGTVSIRSRGSTIVGLDFNGAGNRNALRRGETSVIGEAHRQLVEYLGGNRRNFDLDLGLCGTPFQRRVWNALLTIPFGSTRSYQQVAMAVGNKSATRAVAMACGKNPISLFIPCHRVIYSDGSLGGYSGGLALKRLLLGIEGNTENSIPDNHRRGRVCEE